jgi:DNA invertase Pin-like site-specific DNA recombinase
LDDAVENTRKVSHLAQVEEGERWATAQGYPIVARFEDLGVSAGKTKPWERPGLQEWLAPERLHEWDVLVFSKIDRAFRSTHDCVEFAKWIKANKKVLAFSGDGIVLDYLNNSGNSFEQQMSEFFIYIGSFFAQIELSRFRSRATDRLDFLRMTDRVSHGVAPLGFMTVPHPSGKGKALVKDPEGYTLLHQIYDKLVNENWSLTGVVRWLNDSGLLSNRAKASGGKWSTTTLRRTLQSERLQGFRTMAVYAPAPTPEKPDHKKRVGEKLVLDAEGLPIRMADPTFSDGEWERLQAVLAVRSKSGRAHVMTPNPLAGVVFCQCGKAVTLHRSKSTSGKVHTYVRCGGGSVDGCKGSKRLNDLEVALQTVFLTAFGDREMTRQVFVKGEDRSRELAQVEQSLDRLRWESDNGLVEDEDLYRQRLSALAARRRDLAAEPVIASRWEPVGTGMTYRELWADPDTDRRQVLRDSRIRLVVGFIPRKVEGSVVSKVIPIRFETPEGWPVPEPVQMLLGMLAQFGVDGVDFDDESVSFTAPDGRTVRLPLDAQSAV